MSAKGFAPVCIVLVLLFFFIGVSCVTVRSGISSNHLGRLVIYRIFDVEWSLEAENEELRARNDAIEKKEGVQVEPGIPAKEGGNSEDV